MRPWEVWDFEFAWGTHPAVIVSNPVRVERKPEVVVLACRSLRPGTDRAAAPLPHPSRVKRGAPTASFRLSR